MGINAPLTLFALLAIVVSGFAISFRDKTLVLANVVPKDSLNFPETFSPDSVGDSNVSVHPTKILNALTSDPLASRRSAMQNIRRRRQSGADSGIAAGFSALRCRLYCQNGYYLQSHLDGTINGTKEAASKFAVLEMLRVAVKLVSIRGATGGNYICMNRKGKMYGSRRRNAECVFVEEYLETKTFVYSSRKFSRKRRQLYIGLNRKGRGRRGKRRKQRSVQFYILPVESDSDYAEVTNLEGGSMDTGHAEDNPNIAGDNEPPDLTPDTVETQEVD